MRNLVLTLLISSLAGCASGPEPQPELRWREIPEGYLQPCELPPMPEDTAELSDAFVWAYQCGVIGNRDKERIKSLGGDE